MEFSKRMSIFGESIFTTLANKRIERIKQGKEVIDFSIGAPNIPPNSRIKQAISNACLKDENYLYAIKDSEALLDAVKKWYFTRYHVQLTNNQISSLLGSQEGLSHLALTLINEGDIVLVPDPCYPIFRDGVLLAGGHVEYMPLLKENNYLIDFKSIDESIANQAKFMIVSYPNNPTGAIANDTFYKELIAFAKKHSIIVLHDNAYSELIYEGKGRSFLEYEGAFDVGIEFNSLSKTYGLAGARCGFALGNEAIISQIKTLKSNTDYGMFLPIQLGAIEAITGNQDCVKETLNEYIKRKDTLIQSFKEANWSIDSPKGSMFIWAKIPNNYQSSEKFVYDLFDLTGILMVPGNAFGKHGEGFVRIALVQDIDIIKKAAALIKQSALFNTD